MAIAENNTRTFELVETALASLEEQVSEVIRADDSDQLLVDFSNCVISVHKCANLVRKIPEGKAIEVAAFKRRIHEAENRFNEVNKSVNIDKYNMIAAWTGGPAVILVWGGSSSFSSGLMAGLIVAAIVYIVRSNKLKEADSEFKRLRKVAKSDLEASNRLIDQEFEGFDTRLADAARRLQERIETWVERQQPEYRPLSDTVQDFGTKRAGCMSIPAAIRVGTVRFVSQDDVAKAGGIGIEQITADVEVGAIYEGKVVKLMDFGAFVNILPGRDGLVHISQISPERVSNVSDELSEGDNVKVKVLEVDKQGRIRLSMKAVNADAKPPAISNELRMAQIPLRIPWMFDRARDGHLVYYDVQDYSSFIVQLLNYYKPGTLRLLLIDPVGLGEKFSSFHSLSDHDDKLISGRVWTDGQDIRRQLQMLVEHISAVIQKYLRSDYTSLDEYNESAGEVAEPYRFVFIYGFPNEFDSESILALEKILANGARCGVHVVLLRSANWIEKLPHGSNSKSFDDSPIRFNRKGSDQQDEECPGLMAVYIADPIPDESIVAKVVDGHGRMAREGARVEVPYATMMERIRQDQHGPLAGLDKGWLIPNDSKLAVPLGPSGARKIQMMILGEKGTTAHHALIVGKTGSGKSNLLHVLVMSLAEIYSPKELEVYLVDFKKGVEFKDYATRLLPHARVVAIESELEFGISVLRGLDDEMTRRGAMFKVAGVQDISDFRKQSPGSLMPRIVLIVDEFHELLVEEGQGSRDVLSIIDRVVRQGRGFGIHLVLASQSIAGIRLPRSILDQIGIRIALQCSEADSRLVLADENGAARLLDRAGDAIYNDKNGLVEGNEPFQVALISAEERNAKLDRLRKRALATYSYPEDVPILDGPFVFEGSEPARIESCRPLLEALRSWPALPDSPVRTLWVGEPIAVRPAHSMELKPQSGANLMVIDRDERLGVGVILSAVLSMVAQETPESIRFHIVDLSSADASWADHAEDLRDSFPHPVEVYGRREITSIIAELGDEISMCDEQGIEGRPRIILVLLGLQRARDLRREEGPRLSFTGDSGEDAPAVHEQLLRLLREGPDFGIHTLIWCDTVQNLTRILENAALKEIGHRISGPLSASDSMKLLDDPIASTIERENRMICYDDDRVGVYTQIRPYLPWPREWLTETGLNIVQAWKMSRVDNCRET